MTGFLVIVAVLLLFLILLQVGKTSELSAILKGEVDDFDESNDVNGKLMLAFIVLFLAGIIWSFYLYIGRLLPESASVHGVETDKLFNVTLFLTGIVFILSQIALFWFSYQYRGKKGQKAYFFPHSNMLEVIWTVIPAIVMTVLVVMGLKVWYDIFPSHEDMQADKQIIEVTGKQFNWIIRYPGLDGELGNRIIDQEHITPENELGIDWLDPASHDDVMPDKLMLIKDLPVLVKLGAQDVLHSFYLPHFRVKMDCVPGIPTQFYFVPTITTAEMREKLVDDPEWSVIDPETGESKAAGFDYELACAELCGSSHYGMQRYVEVVTREEYDEWLKAQPSYYETVIKPKLTQAQLEEIELAKAESKKAEESLASINEESL